MSRTNALRAEQVAVSSLSALLLNLKLSISSLANEDVFDQRQVTSSNPAALAASVVGKPPIGTYQFTPLATVQTQQFLSRGLASDTDPLGAGTLTFRFGAHVERTTSLDQFAGGQGIVRGRIRITDRSGSTAEIDLSAVRTVDDVVEAINNSTAIDVTATTRGDRIRLVDNTGQTVSNLKVDEVGGGTTAASLGLAGIDVAASVADGEDMLYLAEDLDLDVLNDGNGLSADPILADIGYTLRDGTTGQIDLSPIIAGGSTVDRESTLGEILDRINAAEPDKLQVEIAPDGQRLLITDLTTGGGQFTLESLNGSNALADLGLDGDSSSGQVTGRRLLGGLRTVLLSSLEGGQGLGTLGQLALTDRSGASDTVDLSAAETLEDVVEAINAAGVAITAGVNNARNGIVLVDTSGASSGNLIVANGDATGTADKLGISVDADVSSIDSGDLHLKIVSHATRLDDLNGGAGVARGIIRIVDSQFAEDELNLNDDDIQTVGDVVRAINRMSVDVVAELNETGDGIRIRDLGDGAGTLTVSDVGSTAAADLHIAGEAVEVDLGGQLTQVIDGATTMTIELDGNVSLADLRDRINELDAGVAATILNDGSNRPYRLGLMSQRPGSQGGLVIDPSGVDLELHETARPRDAVLIFGDPNSPGTNVLLASSSNTFHEIVSGLTLQVNEASASPVTITVSTTDEDLVAEAQAFVQAYNAFREKLAELTEYNAETNTASVLTGDATALRLDTDLSRLVSGRFLGAGTIRSLAQVGIELGGDGTLSLDESKLADAFASDPQAVREFFSHDESGISAKFEDLIDRLAEDDSSLLGQRIKTLDRKIEQSEEKIAFMTERLARERARLELEFYRLELAVGKMQTSLNAIAQIQAIAPLTASSGDG